MSRGIIIFDFDGTIANSFEFVTKFLTEQAGEGHLSRAERREQLVGLSMRDMGGKLGISAWRELWLFFYGRRVMTRHMKQVKPFDGIIETIKSLHAQGYTLFILSSNRNKNVQIFLRQHDIAEYFTVIQGNASLIGKTLALRWLLWKHGLDKDSCAYVGDEAGDLKAARRLGIRAVGVSWGYNEQKKLAAEEPSAIAKTPADLLKIFARKKITEPL